MKAAILRQPGRVDVEDVPDPVIVEPTDAVVRVVAAGICGTDMRGYLGRPGPVQGGRCGHEFLGRVDDVGPDVFGIRRGAMVIAPFTYSDGSCPACARGLTTSCASGAMWGGDVDGGQAEAVRVPFADATLVAVPVPVDDNDERLPSLLALCDVMATGHHAVASVRMPPPGTVVVVGDGAVGLCAVIAARAAGAERVILMSHHEPRAKLGSVLGAHDIISATGAEARAEVLDLTAGTGADMVIDAVGEQDAAEAALAVCADGGTLSLVGGPHGQPNPMACFLRNITLGGGLTPARAYLPALLSEVLAGRLDPSPVFDREVRLTDIDAGYRDMAARTATKVLVRP